MLNFFNFTNLINYPLQVLGYPLQSNQLDNIQENPQPFNPLLSPTTRIETYQDFIINLTPNELEELERKMQLLLNDNQDINIDLVLKAIREPDTLDPIWNHLDFPLYALLALKQGKMDGMDFSTSQMFYNVINHPTHKDHIQTIPLFINESVNPQAWELIKETVQPFISQKYEEIDKNKIANNQSFMTPLQQQVFFDMIRQLRSLQKIFLLVPEPQPISFNQRAKIIENRLGTITSAINVKSPCFNVFCRVSDKEFGKPLRMIPSKGMMQAYLFATGGTSTLISQFGLASFQYLHKGINGNERCMCLNFAFLPKINQADKRICLSQVNEVEYHDFYHIDIMNLIRKDLVKFAGIAELLQKMSQKKSDQQRVIQLLYETWIDMEHLAYRLFYSKKLPHLNEVQLEALFWCSFCSNFVFVSYLSKSLSKQNFISTDIAQAIIEELVEEADSYQKEYNLNIDFLLNFDSNLSKLTLLKRADFESIQFFIDAINNKINSYLTPIDKLQVASKHSKSYLIRHAASRELAKIFN